MKNGVKFIQHNLVCVKNKMLFYLNIFSQHCRLFPAVEKVNEKI